MTIETRTTIEPKDIQAIEFECKDCGTKTVRKIDNKFRTPMACGNCNSPWFNEHRPEAAEFQKFLGMLEHYMQNQFPYTIRFQIPAKDDEE